MKILKYGTPKQQILHIACDCGCEYELYDNEIWEGLDQELIKTICPTCGYPRNVSRDYIQIVAGYCIGNRCLRMSCGDCNWRS